MSSVSSEKTLVTIVITGLSVPPPKVVAALPVHIVHRPLIRIQHVTPLPELPPVDWLFWTSQQAVKAVFSNGFATSWLITHVKNAALGPAEAKALAHAGLLTHWQAPDATGITAATAFTQYLPSQQHIGWVCGNRANPAIANALRQQGHTVTVIPVYETVTVMDAFPPPPTDTWLFTSPSTVEAFTANRWTVQPKQVVGALGPTTAKAIQHHLGLEPFTANPSGDWQHVLQSLLNGL
jgi:uroporphyrinogen-III synthase